MEEKWLKINEIEYSYQQLSEIYNRIDVVMLIIIVSVIYLVIKG